MAPECTLQKSFVIDEKYTVMLFIKRGSNAETYRVKGTDGKLYFLKLFHYSKIHNTAFDNDGNLLEIELLKSVTHPNIVSYKDSGELVYSHKKFAYLILEFIVGETLAERMVREPFVSWYDVKQIMSGVLEGLNYLHSLPDPVIHNEITPQNIMLDLSGYTPRAQIIDFGHARLFHQPRKSYNRDGLNLNYLASECFHNVYSPQTDLFSVGAVMYYMLFGMPPWFMEISKFKADRGKAEDTILEKRRSALTFPDISNIIIDFDESIPRIIEKALQLYAENRFQSAQEFIQVLNGEIEIDDRVQKVKSIESPVKKKQSHKSSRKGFDAIAGMSELKEQLQLDVIDALHHSEKYAKYGITIPNGMLLYGPPGCGKTFFAKHFAEEVGFNFMLMTPSSLKSKYVNATQENIAQVFEDAEKNAPTIIFIDEINELLPCRDSDVHEMSKSAVNEMLAQMDRTGEKGIFVIGATNYPDMIEPAMLRAGRLDKKFYLPPPDFEARKAMFEMYLKNRPVDFGVDYVQLANLTENYVSSDIAFIVNETARLALRLESRITIQLLEDVIQKTKPSVSLRELEKYEAVKAKIDSENNESSKSQTRIGF